jgi:hypothetical protein
VHCDERTLFAALAVATLAGAAERCVDGGGVVSALPAAVSSGEPPLGDAQPDAGVGVETSDGRRLAAAVEGLARAYVALLAAAAPPGAAVGKMSVARLTDALAPHATPQECCAAPAAPSVTDAGAAIAALLPPPTWWAAEHPGSRATVSLGGFVCDVVQWLPLGAAPPSDPSRPASGGGSGESVPSVGGPEAHAGSAPLGVAGGGVGATVGRDTGGTVVVAGARCVTLDTAARNSGALPVSSEGGGVSGGDAAAVCGGEQQLAPRCAREDGGEGGCGGVGGDEGTPHTASHRPKRTAGFFSRGGDEGDGAVVVVVAAEGGDGDGAAAATRAVVATAVVACATSVALLLTPPASDDAGSSPPSTLFSASPTWSTPVAGAGGAPRKQPAPRLRQFGYSVPTLE